MTQHHDESRAKEPWEMAGLIRMSCKMANSAGFPAFASCQCEPFEALREELPAREKRLFHTEVGTLLFEIQRKLQAVEAI